MKLKAKTVRQGSRVRAAKPVYGKYPRPEFAGAEETMNQFQALVHALLEARDMTVAELARQSGLHEQTLYKLLRGRRDKADVSKQRIDPDTVDAIAQVLGSRTQLHRAAAQARGYVIEELPDSIDPDFDALIVLARDASPERLEIAKNVLRAALNESRPD